MSKFMNEFIQGNIPLPNHATYNLNASSVCHDQGKARYVHVPLSFWEIAYHRAFTFHLETLINIKPKKIESWKKSSLYRFEAQTWKNREVSFHFE